MLGRLLLLLMFLFGHAALANPNGTPDWTYSVEPGNWVNSVAISSQGKEILAGSCNLIATSPGDYHVVALDYKGNEKWVDNLVNTYRGIFWTAISRNGTYGAVGGLYSQLPYHGFVRAYNMATGQKLLNETGTEQRVNVVALSQDGIWLIAADGGSQSTHSTLRLYKLNVTANPNVYVLADSFDAGSQSIGTAAMSQDGAWIVIGEGGNSGTGIVRLFHVVNDKLVLSKTWYAPAGVLYVQAVDMSDNGDWFGVALPNHTIAMFKTQDFATSGNYAWTVSVNHNCGGHNVYALRVYSSGNGIVAGSNCGLDSSGGWIDTFTNPPQSAAPTPAWSLHTDRPPNAVDIDKSASYEIVADGHPLDTLSYFYLIKVATGEEVWKYQTGNMNWAAAISENGDAVVGGSDDGKVYFWNNAPIIPHIDPNKFKYKPKIPWWEWPMDQRNVNQQIQRGEQFGR